MESLAEARKWESYFCGPSHKERAQTRRSVSFAIHCLMGNVER